jgi:hypothetical protein
MSVAKGGNTEPLSTQYATVFDDGERQSGHSVQLEQTRNHSSNRTERDFTAFTRRLVLGEQRRRETDDAGAGCARQKVSTR